MPDAPIDTLLEQMVAHNASDLHLTVGSKPVLRLRGHLHRMETLPVLTAEDTRHLLYRITSTEQQKQLELNRQLDMSYSIPGVARFRVNLYSQRESLAGAFRLIPTEPRSRARDAAVSSTACARSRATSPPPMARCWPGACGKDG